MNQRLLNIVLLMVLTAFVVSAAIYLTPLKHIALIEPSIQDVDPKEFYDEYVNNKDGYIFIDVRGPTSYNHIHAKDSINIPLHELYEQRKVLPRSDKEIVLICSGGVASGVGYHYLQHHGFFNIKRVAGGIEAWEAVGLPIEGSVD